MCLTDVVLVSFHPEAAQLSQCTYDEVLPLITHIPNTTAREKTYFYIS